MIFALVGPTPILGIRRFLLTHSWVSAEVEDDFNQLLFNLAEVL